PARDSTCSLSLHDALPIYFNDIDTTFLDAGDPAVVAAQVVADLDSMHTAGAANQRLHALLIAQHPDHLETFDIEAFEELSGPILIRFDILGASLALGQIDPDRRLERAAQRAGTVGECLIGNDLRQWLDIAGRT